MSFEIPKTRSEKILQNILGAKNEIEPIQSRIEAILFAILNDTEIGDPYTAPARCEIEKLLVAIKDGGEYNETPLTRSGKILLCKLRGEDYLGITQSRLEKLFLRWLYELMEITDVPPFTFKSKGNNLIDYDIYGAEDGVGDYQDATVSGNTISVSDAVEAPAESLKVTFTPTQDGTPSIDSEPTTEPYLSKVIPRGNKEYYGLVGATVAWNQLVQNGDFASTQNWSISGAWQDVSVSDGVLHLKSTANQASYTNITQTLSDIIQNHVYMFSGSVKASKSSNFGGSIGTSTSGAGWSVNYTANTWTHVDAIKKVRTFTDKTLYLRPKNSADEEEVDVYIKNINVTDLTLMFANNPAIADYAYSLEQSSAGSGIAWLKSYGFFTKDYYPYNPGELISVNTSGKKIVGFNQWDEKWELGTINVDGSLKASSNSIRTKNFIRVIPNTRYYINNSNFSSVYGYDKDKNFVVRGFYASASDGIGWYFNIPSNVYYIKVPFIVSYGTTYNHDICINISDPQKNGAYKPYVTNTYPIDPTDLRGLFKLSNGKLYCEGDIYPPSGSVERSYGIVVINGSQGTFSNPNTNQFNVDGLISDFYREEYAKTCICGTYQVVSCRATNAAFFSEANNLSKAIGFTSSVSNTLRIKDVNYTSIDDFKAYLAQHPITVVYELATPATESATPYTSPVDVEAGGTEEFVDNRTVPVPVGNETYYASEYEVHGKTGVTVSHGATEDDPNPTEHEVEFTQQGTVYGGTVDIVTGVLTVTWAILSNPQNLHWISNGSQGMKNFQTDEGVVNKKEAYGTNYNWKCSRYSNGWSGSDAEGIRIYNNGVVAIRDYRYWEHGGIPSEVAAFKASLADVTIAYELATPQTYQLTTQQVQMLLNNNYLTTPDGTITLTYKGMGINVPFSVSCGGESNSYNVGLTDKLYKVSAYADSISYDDQTVKREIIVERLDGSEEWVLNDGVFSTTLSVVARTPAVLCNELTSEQCYLSEDLTTINITNVPFEYVSELKTWLESKEVYIQYVRENTLVTSHTVPEVSTFNGTNTFSVDTEVTPSEVTIIYPNRVTTRALPKTKKIGKSKLTKSK